MAGNKIESSIQESRPLSRVSEWGAQLLAALALLALMALTPACSSLNFSRLKFWQRSPKVYADVEVRPASGDTNRLLQNAHYLTLMGRPELALKELEDAFQREPQNAKVANALARGYEEVGAYDKAQQVYQQALSRGADSPALHNNLCYSYYLAGNLKKAESCFRQALERDPGNVAARNNLGLLLCRSGRQEEARRLWQEAEGQAAADKKMQEVLAFLKTPAAAAYARRAPAAVPVPAPVAEKKPASAAARPEAKAVAAPAESAPAAASPGKAAETLAAAAVSSPPAKAPEKIAAAAPPAPPAPAPAPEAAPASKKTSAPTPAAASAPPKAAAARPPREQPLTATELTETAIKVENGNGYPDLAHDTREFLTGEGFNVVAISNYLDFGVEDTVIYYRPAAARLAKVLGEKFHTANVQVKEELPPGIDVRVIMGHDLLLKEDLLEKLAG